jgi:uncharacterized protein YkwD
MIRRHSVDRFFLAAVFPALFLILKVGAQEPSFSSVGTGKNLEFRNGLEQEAFSLVNGYRKKSKLLPFFWNDDIARVAREHSRDMATGKSDFGHDGFDGRVNRLKTVMVQLKGCGENVLKTDDPDQTARNAVALWLRSPAHLHNIQGDYNYSGLGVWVDKDGMIYFTQIFVKVDPRVESAQAAPDMQAASPFGLLAPVGARTQP